MNEIYLGLTILDLRELKGILSNLSLKYTQEKDEVNSENYGRMCDECASLLKSLEQLPTNEQPKAH